MINTSFDFNLPEFADGDTDPVEGSIGTAISSRYRVVDEPVRVISRLWLDTFDWRLRDAGLRLAYVREEDDNYALVLNPGIGESVQRLSRNLSWPSLPEHLPAGPVSQRLQPLAGLRAFLPLVESHVTVHPFNILNADEKIVVRARVERVAAVPAKLSLTAVRGYTKQAERVADLVRAIDGVTASEISDVDSLLVAAGRKPGAKIGLSSAHLEPGQSSVDALSSILLVLLDIIEINIEGTIADWDTEFLHDLRVAVRRTRSALKLAGDALPHGLSARFAPEFKWLGDLTTPVRDLDAFLLNFDQLRRGLVEAEPADLDAFYAHVHRYRNDERQRLIQGLRSSQCIQLMKTWRDELNTVRSHLGSGETGTSGSLNAEVLAAARLRRAWRKVIRLGSSITVDSPPQALHDLRKRCKELRYVLELFGPLYPTDTRRVLVKELKILQDCLGEFQDAEVHRDALRLHAAAMLETGGVNAATILAMGELVAQLGQRQRLAAQESLARFSRFAAPRNERRVASVTENQ